MTNSFSIDGTDSMPAVNGGYLIVSVDGKELCVLSVPSLILGADRYRDSVTENSDCVEDESGNVFNLSVFSSNVGVDWDLEVETENRKLQELINVEYRANEY